jgi:uncharacterized protein YqeY
MTLQEQIKFDLKESMTTNIPKRDLLKVVVGEMSREENKELTDEQVLRILKRMVEGATECNNVSEIKILSTYMPEKVTEKEVFAFLQEILSFQQEYYHESYTMKDMGKLIAESKEYFGKKFDGKIVSDCIKKIFS